MICGAHAHVLKHTQRQGAVRLCTAATIACCAYVKCLLAVPRGLSARCTYAFGCKAHQVPAGNHSCCAKLTFMALQKWSAPLGCLCPRTSARRDLYRADTGDKLLPRCMPRFACCTGTGQHDSQQARYRQHLAISCISKQVCHQKNALTTVSLEGYA